MIAPPANVSRANEEARQQALAKAIAQNQIAMKLAQLLADSETSFTLRECDEILRLASKYLNPILNQHHQEQDTSASD